MKSDNINDNNEDIYIQCKECFSKGIINNCYLTGFPDKKNLCNHDNGLALKGKHDGDADLLTCKEFGCSCQLFITGFDVKCGHDNGWAREYSKKSLILAKQQKVREENEKRKQRKIEQMEQKKNNYRNLKNSIFEKKDKKEIYIPYNDNDKFIKSKEKENKNINNNENNGNNGNIYLKETIKNICNNENYREYSNSIDEDFNLLGDDSNELKDRIRILQAKLNDKDNHIKSLNETIDKYEKNIIKDIKGKGRFSKYSNNKEINNGDITEYFFKNHKFNEILTEVKDSKITDLYPLLDSFDKKQILENCQKEVYNILDMEFEFFSVKINEKVIEMIKETNILIKESDEKSNKITKELTESKIPNNIINESIKPLNSHVNDLKNKIERLEKLKQKFNVFYQINEI